MSKIPIQIKAILIVLVIPLGFLIQVIWSRMSFPSYYREDRKDVVCTLLNLCEAETFRYDTEIASIRLNENELLEALELYCKEMGGDFLHNEIKALSDHTASCDTELTYEEAFAADKSLSTKDTIQRDMLKRLTELRISELLEKGRAKVTDKRDNNVVEEYISIDYSYLHSPIIGGSGKRFCFTDSNDVFANITSLTIN